VFVSQKLTKNLDDCSVPFLAKPQQISCEFLRQGSHGRPRTSGVGCHDHQAAQLHSEGIFLRKPRIWDDDILINRICCENQGFSKQNRHWNKTNWAVMNEIINNLTLKDRKSMFNTHRDYFSRTVLGNSSTGSSHKWLVFEPFSQQKMDKKSSFD